MRANPNPFNAVTDLMAQCAIMITNANGKAFGTTAEFLEIKRRMTRIVAPEPVIFHGQPMDGLRQLLIEFPKPPRGSGSHSLSEGQS